MTSHSCSFISQLEPHFQNDAKRFIAPNGVAERFQDFLCAPGFCVLFPGKLAVAIADYYGLVCEAIERFPWVESGKDSGGAASRDNTIFV